MDINSVITAEPNPKIPSFRSGDRIKVNIRVREGDRERLQTFQGDVIRKRGGGPGSTFTVRRVSHGTGVERTFPLHSPSVESVEVVIHTWDGEQMPAPGKRFHHKARRHTTVTAPSFSIL